MSHNVSQEIWNFSDILVAAAVVHMYTIMYKISFRDLQYNICSKHQSMDHYKLLSVTDQLSTAEGWFHKIKWQQPNILSNIAIFWQSGGWLEVFLDNPIVTVTGILSIVENMTRYSGHWTWTWTCRIMNYDCIGNVVYWSCNITIMEDPFHRYKPFRFHFDWKHDAWHWTYKDYISLYPFIPYSILYSQL